MHGVCETSSTLFVLTFEIKCLKRKSIYKRKSIDIYRALPVRDIRSISS